ncbi:MAG: CAP domain-containing protein [Patescibacteria group bacterium]|nr:CAP domain-containing protein [Patescibacteria group bacterium]
MSVWKRLVHAVVPSPHNAYKPHLLRREWMLFFLAAMLATEGFFVADIVVRQSGATFLAAVVQSDIIALTNTQRASNNVGTLKENRLLDLAATAKAKDMAAKGYFSHVGPDGKVPWAWIEGVGYNYQYAGENLAVRFTDSKDVVNAWMASPTHRANIVKPQYSDIGVGVADGTYQGQPATFVVQYFGSPLAEVQQGRVLAAETSQPLNTFSRMFARIASNPRSTSDWLIGGMGALVALVVVIGFFVHHRIQALEMLAGGAVVSMVAAGLIILNTGVLATTVAYNGTNQAAVGALAPGGGVVIDPVAGFSEGQ